MRQPVPLSGAVGGGGPSHFNQAIRESRGEIAFAEGFAVAQVQGGHQFVPRQLADQGPEELLDLGVT